MSGANDWSTEQLAEFLAGISDSESEDAALQLAVERVGRALEADGCAYVRDHEVRSSWGFGLDQVPEEDMEGDGNGDSTMVVPVVGELGGNIVLAREGRPFEIHERALVRSMGGALSLTVGKIENIRAERERWDLLTRLSLLQRSLSHHAPFQDVLDSVSEAARELLGEAVAGVALSESDEDPSPPMRSLAGAAVRGIDRGRARIDAALARRAMDADSPTVIGEASGNERVPEPLAAAGIEAAILAPVREAGEVCGLLLVGSTTPGRRFSAPEREALSAFAEHASLALTDARLSDQIDRALHDTLTGLPNRAFLGERLAGVLDSFPATPAIFVLDLDSFRDINDRLGHRAGDAVLIEVARRLSEAADPDDLVARLDGDSFAIVSSANRASELGSAILAAAAEPFELDGRTLRTTASVGLVIAGDDADQMLRDADLAMHRAKAEGRARIVTFEPKMHEEVVSRLEMQDDFVRALGADEIVAYFQPKVDLRTGRVIGVEALVRWDHPERGLASPAEFLDLAEAGGHMRALTERVIEYSARAAGDWWRSGLGLQLSVNLAASSFSEGDYRIDEYVKRALARSGLPGTALQFEVTEDALMADPEVAAKILNRLSRLGAMISIDDFGTGHSSLGRLKSLPIDELKIDRSFILDLAEEEDKTIVRSTIHLAHQMGLQVIAEGVETEEAWRQLRSMGCERAQGFLISKPLPAREIPAWLASWNQRARQLSSARRVQTRRAEEESKAPV